MNQQGQKEPLIGLALSGGGFRATAFHLGTLKRLEELGILTQISLISTVSGGSITGPLYALRCVQRGDGTPGSYPVDSLIGELRPFLRGNLRGRALFGTPIRTIRTFASFAIPPLRRTPLLAKELDRSLFHSAQLADLPEWIAINASNLSTGRAWRFYRDRAGDYFVGATEKTAHIRVAEAVIASAAFPGLTDPYPFSGKWEDFRTELLDSRWDQPAEPETRWRKRYGASQGAAIFPLVDGGVYDNHGMNALRAFGITYAIVSSAEQAWSGYKPGRLIRTLARTVAVIHGRLGWITRQWIHEATHQANPNQARKSLLGVANSLREVRAHVTPAVRETLSALEDTIRRTAAVGWPPRGKQFVASAQILLNSTNVATNWSSRFTEDPYDIPLEDRGLSEDLVEELARVRTDLDALEDDVIDALIAQGYFLTDAYVKIAMPDLISSSLATADPRGQRPRWVDGHDTVRKANATPDKIAKVLLEAQNRKKIGRAGNPSERIKILFGLVTGSAVLFVLTALALWIVCRGITSWR